MAHPAIEKPGGNSDAFAARDRIPRNVPTMREANADCVFYDWSFHA
jgi:hypothetical protein